MIPKYYKIYPDYYILNLVQERLVYVTLGSVGLKGGGRNITRAALE